MPSTKFGFYSNRELVLLYESGSYLPADKDSLMLEMAARLWRSS